MVEDADSGLIKRAKAGDQAAFGELVNRYYEMVYAVAFGILHNREAARDVAQESFIKAHRQLSKFEEKAKFKTWVYRIAVNSAIDEQRKKKPTDSLDATDVSDDEDHAPVIITDPNADPREDAHQSELRVLIMKALDGLTPDHRAVLVLREWQGFSYEEIAETLNLEVGTVMSRLFYARKKMAEALAPKLDIKKGSYEKRST